MIRSIALLAVFAAYQVADVACRVPGIDHGWLRTWVPPLILATGALVWMIRWPLSTGSVPKAWAGTLRIGVGVLGCAIVSFAFGAPGTPSDTVPTRAEFSALVTIVPFGEELLFRGALLRYLRHTFGTTAGVIAVSVLFGSLHGAGPNAIAMFVLSLVLCAAALCTRSLLLPVALHALWNGSALLHRIPTTDGRLSLALALGAVVIVSAICSQPKLEEA